MDAPSAARAARTQLVRQLQELGVGTRDVLLVHSSLKSLGAPCLGPDDVIDALLQVVGPAGTLLMPALTYAQQPAHIHSTASTPSHVGIIPETYRRRQGTIRSVHPTHSVCGRGPAAAELLGAHRHDSTPCGRQSPFRRILERPADILMLGCGLRPNTTMHAIEELVEPPYLFGPERVYDITDDHGARYRRTYRTHGFAGWSQRYDRIAGLAVPGLVCSGPALAATVHLLRADLLREAAVERLHGDAFFFVERTVS